MTSRYAVTDLRTGTCLGDRVWMARGFAERFRGLLGRPALTEGEGLLLEGCASVHTCFMRFPIDLCFLDASSRILKTVETLGPWRAAACPGAAHVLELPAGVLSLRQVLPGDALEVRRCA